MKLPVALIAGVVIALSASGEVRAQAAAPAQPVFNPFATFSLSRFSFNTLGFLTVSPTNPFAAPGSATTVAPVSGSGDDEIPQAVVPRPPYRPPVRSAYRPPPRPPF